MPSNKPRLRPDLKITRHVQGDGVRFVIKDPQTGDYYQFPQDQFSVVQLFDGTHTVEEIPALYNRAHPDTEIDADTVREFHSSLDRLHLIDKPLAEQNLFLLERMRESRKKALLGAKGNLMMMRFVLFDPDRLLNRIYPSVKWLFSPVFLVCAALFVTGAVVLVLQEYDRVAEGIESITTFAGQTPLAIFGLWVTVVVVIFLHELGHAFTCKHFGGEVHEIGILLMFFMPCFFANVNDAWTFEKRYQKLAVTFAGGLVEFFVGAVAAYLWFVLNPASPLSAICYQTMTICAVSSVLFNFNPLMKLDGYYAFSDFTGIPNLRAESGKYTAYFFQRYALHLKTDSEPFEGYTIREKRILLIYGVASSIYLFGVMTGLFFMVQNMMIGALGALGVIAGFWFGWTIFKGYIMKFRGFIAKLWSQKGALVRRHPAVSAAAVLVCAGAALYGFSMQPMVVKRPCTLEPLNPVKVFAGISGTLDSSVIRSGMTVTAGQRLAVLVNAEQKEELLKLEIQRELQNAALSKAFGSGDASARYRAQLELQRIGTDIAALKAEQQKRAICAPIDGVVLSTRTDQGYRPWFNRGSEICEICRLDSLRITLTVLESEIGAVSPGNPSVIRLYSSLSRSIRGAISSVAPISKNYGDPKKEDSGKGAENEFAITVLVKNLPGLDLKPRMSGNIRIRSGTVRGFALAVRELRKALRADLFY